MTFYSQYNTLIKLLLINILRREILIFLCNHVCLCYYLQANMMSKCNVFMNALRFDKSAIFSTRQTINIQIYTEYVIEKPFSLYTESILSLITIFP